MRAGTIAPAGAALRTGSAGTAAPVFALALVLGAAHGARGAEVLWDNGIPDHLNGYSNATDGVFGFRRSVLDDFVVPEGQAWRLGALRWSHIWNTLEPPAGSGAELAVWSDADGAPGERIHDLAATGYEERVGEIIYFHRLEARSWATFEPVVVGPGRYWIEGAIVGPENDFWLSADVREEQCWVNYEDLGGLISSESFFGLATDLAWQLEGTRTGLVTFDYPSGLPATIDHCGERVRVEVVARVGTLDPASPTLHYDAGGGFVEVPMEPAGGSAYEAVFPALRCGALARWYLSARTIEGDAAVDPLGAPGDAYRATAIAGRRVLLADDAEQDPGWTVVNEDVEDGAWARGVPQGDGGFRGPAADYDGSGQCWTTGLALESDVDGGPTRLVSPPLDLRGVALAEISYARWHTSDSNDFLLVEISSDDGATWALVGAVTGEPGWVFESFRAGDVLEELTRTVRLRFSLEDIFADSRTEAAIDAVEVANLCPFGDADGDGDVDVADVIALLVAWGPCPPPESPCPADFDRSGTVDVADLLHVLATWGPCT